MPEIDDWIHPLDALARRDPLTGQAVRVVVLYRDDAALAQLVGRGLSQLLKHRGRKSEVVVASVDPGGWSEALRVAAEEASQPILLVTTAAQVWSLAHLDPLLEAIDTKDHVFGRRAESLAGRLKRWWKTLPWQLVFASPVLDIHSPCQVHRLTALQSLSLQSRSRFVEVEIASKATWLKHLIDEVPVPTLAAIADDRPIRDDFRELLDRPRFLAPIKST